MNTPDTDYIVVGKIGATFGIKGWSKIISFTEPLINIASYKPWYISEGTGWKPIQIVGSKEHGKNIIARINGVNTPEAARLFTGREIAIKRSQLPKLKDNEYYWSDLIGLTVINQRNEVLGKVTHLIATGTNDVLVVKDTKEHAIPFLLDEVITQIDLPNGTMHVNWELI